MRSRATVFAGGALMGGMLGWLLAQGHIGRHREDLFSPRPLRRLAALGYLAGRPGVETIRLLRDYLAWESEPMLRRRAEGMVRRIEANLVHRERQ